VNFRNEAKKSTQAVARLIEKSGGPIDYLRVAKLIYLADRESIVTRGVPIVGGHYLSMQRGPTISEIMNFVSRSKVAPCWKETISPRHGHELRLLVVPEYVSLSESELKILDETVKAHLGRTTDELVEWCHENCPEYEEVPPGRRKPILVEEILTAANKSAKQIRKIVQEAVTLEELDKLLT